MAELRCRSKVPFHLFGKEIKLMFGAENHAKQINASFQAQYSAKVTSCNPGIPRHSIPCVSLAHQCKGLPDGLYLAGKGKPTLICEWQVYLKAYMKSNDHHGQMHCRSWGCVVREKRGLSAWSLPAGGPFIPCRGYCKRWQGLFNPPFGPRVCIT